MGVAPNFEYIQTCATPLDMTTVAHAWSARMYPLATDTQSGDSLSELFTHSF